MSPLLPPVPRVEHVCEPPTEPLRVPTGPAGSSTGRNGTPTHPPMVVERRGSPILIVTAAVGSTWDCPTCHAVWVVRAPDQPGRWQPHVGYRPSARRWAVASMRKTREHHARAGTFVGSDWPPSPPRWPRWIAWPCWLFTAAAGAAAVWGALQ